MSDTSTGTISIEAPVARVQEILFDLASYPQWSTSIKSAEVQSSDGEGRVTSVKLSIEAGVMKDRVTLDYDWSNAPGRLEFSLSDADLLTAMEGAYVISDFVAGEASYFAERNLNIQTETLGAFNSKDVSAANQVTIALANADLKMNPLGEQTETYKISNYTIAGEVSGAGVITPAPVTVAFNTSRNFNKVYDGSSSRTLTPASDLVLSGVVTGETINVVGRVTGVYGYTGANDSSVASGRVTEVKSISATMAEDNFAAGAGADFGNYALPVGATAQTAAAITPKAISVTAVAESKTFDAKTTAKAAVSFDRTALVGADQVELNFTSSDFENNQVGVKKTVTVRGLALTDADASNYRITSGGDRTTTEATSEADIRPINQPTVFVPPSIPSPAPFVPPNTGNTAVQSVGGLGVINVGTATGNTSVSGGAVNVSIDTLVSAGNAIPNQVYVVDGGIRTEK